VTTAGFHDVVAAFQAPPPRRTDPRTPARVTVLGSGVEGRALAAWFLAEGADEVRLFTVYAKEVEALSRGSITLRGEGPIGTFRVGGDRPSVEVTSVLDSAVAASDLIVVSGPVLKQRTYGLVLAQHLLDGQVIVVVPAMTFGGLELAHWLRAGGSTADVTIVELQSLPFDVTDEAGTVSLTRRRRVQAAVLPQGSTSTIERVAGYLPDVDAAPSVLHSSLSDPTGLVEVPALLLGGPAAPVDARSIPPGAVPTTLASFASLIGERHRDLIGALAAERRSVAAGFGVRDLPDDQTLIAQAVGSPEGDGVRAVPVPAVATALVRDAVLGSLVPLVSAAEAAGVSVPATRAVITLAEAVLGGDLEAAGRSLHQIGFGGLDAGAIRTRLATGGRQ
jgi:opine dehydrogenase